LRPSDRWRQGPDSRVCHFPCCQERLKSAHFSAPRGSYEARCQPVPKVRRRARNHIAKAQKGPDIKLRRRNDTDFTAKN
jgi:hypothetical protein